MHLNEDYFNGKDFDYNNHPQELELKALNENTIAVELYFDAHTNKAIDYSNRAENILSQDIRDVKLHIIDKDDYIREQGTHMLDILFTRQEMTISDIIQFIIGCNRIIYPFELNLFRMGYVNNGIENDYETDSADEIYYYFTTCARRNYKDRDLGGCISSIQDIVTELYCIFNNKEDLEKQRICFEVLQKLPCMPKNKYEGCLGNLIYNYIRSYFNNSINYICYDESKHEIQGEYMYLSDKKHLNGQVVEEIIKGKDNINTFFAEDDGRNLMMIPCFVKPEDSIHEIYLNYAKNLLKKKHSFVYPSQTTLVVTDNTNLGILAIVIAHRPHIISGDALQYFILMLSGTKSDVFELADEIFY